MDTNLFWLEIGKNYMSNFKKHNIFLKYIFWKQERAIRKILPRDIETILEIGCGFGRITTILLENPNIKRIVAIDISLDQIQNSIRQIKDSRVEYHVLSALDLNYEKEFDLVIASEVLMHISAGEEIKKVIKNMENASKKYIINIDWFAPKEKKEAGGWCWQHDYINLYKNCKLIKKLHRQGIFMDRI